MTERHRLLERQLARVGPESEWPDEWRLFVEAVEQAYRAADQDRALLERTLELSSRELTEKNAQTRAMFEAFPDLYFCVDLEGRILHYSAGAEAATLAPAGGLTGRRIQDVPIPEAAAGFENALEQLRTTGVARSIEYSLGSPDESRCEARFVPISAGRIAVFVRDVTELRRAEAALRHADKMSAVGQLAAGVAHEINNPLGVILGFAQSLTLRLKAGDPLELPLRSIEREAQRCKSLVRTLLGFTRESRRESASPEDPLAMLAEAMALIESQAKILKGIRVVTEAPARLPAVRMNSGQLQQVLINLCTNALDAMPGGGTLTVGLDVEGGELVMRVSDTGSGIPAELRERVFEPFFTTKPVGKGTGLGLSLVYEIVRAHNGRIDLDSEPGRGSAFTVRLPAASAAPLTPS